MGRLRRLASLVCLGAMLSGQVASAKSLIVYPYNANNTTDLRRGKQQGKHSLYMLQSILRTTGAEFSAVSSRDSRTEWFRTGKQVWGLGAGAYVEQFDASIALMHAAVSTFAGQVRPDSLSRSVVQGGSDRSDSAVPALIIRSSENALGGEPPPTWGSSIDSTGITETTGGGGLLMYQNGQTQPWIEQLPVLYGIGLVDDGANLRPIIYGRGAQVANIGSSRADGATIACKWCDSIPSFTASDTLALWDKFWGSNGKGLAQATTITYAMHSGLGPIADSADGVEQPAAEGDMVLLLAALAHLDSLVRASSTTGGKVLGDKVIQVAPVVYGGLARGERHAWKSPGSAQGIFGADTSGHYAILDSLDALGIPIVFAINPDSVASYERDLIKMKQVRRARFTPQIWNGISDSTKAGGQDALYRPVDVIGRYRSRIAIGDDSGLGADSSIKTLAKSSLRMVDSLVGRDRTSRFFVAPDDDWSPKNVWGVSGMPTKVHIDSVMLALQQAGFQGVVADGQDPEANASKREGTSATNPRGFYNQQQSYNSSRIGLKNFRILTHSGYMILGGESQVGIGADSTTQNSAYLTYSRALSRLFVGALMDFDENYDLWKYDGFSAYDNISERRVDRVRAGQQRAVVRGNVYRLSMADLSGVNYGGPGGAPAANGYWVLKYAKNAMDTINRLAGRTVIRFAYPEDIEP